MTEGDVVCKLLTLRARIVGVLVLKTNNFFDVAEVGKVRHMHLWNFYCVFLRIPQNGSDL